MANTNFKPRKSQVGNSLIAEALAESRPDGLERACRRLRDFERVAFSEDRCSAAGLAVSQFRLLLLRRQHGIPVEPEKLLRAGAEVERLLEAAA